MVGIFGCSFLLAKQFCSFHLGSEFPSSTSRKKKRKTVNSILSDFICMYVEVQDSADFK